MVQHCVLFGSAVWVLWRGTRVGEFPMFAGNSSEPGAPKTARGAAGTEFCVVFSVSFLVKGEHPQSNGGAYFVGAAGENLYDSPL